MHRNDRRRTTIPRSESGQSTLSYRHGQDAPDPEPRGAFTRVQQLSCQDSRGGCRKATNSIGLAKRAMTIAPQRPLFHSPAAWVVEKHMHCVGMYYHHHLFNASTVLISLSKFQMSFSRSHPGRPNASRVQNLYVPKECVAMLGR